MFCSCTERKASVSLFTAMETSSYSKVAVQLLCGRPRERTPDGHCPDQTRVETGGPPRMEIPEAKLHCTPNWMHFAHSGFFSLYCYHKFLYVYRGI